MKRCVFLALLLTAVVLLVPAFVLIGCESLNKTEMTGPSVAEGPIPNPEFPPVPGETPGESMPPGEPMPPGGTPGEMNPPSGTPGGNTTPTTKKTTTTAASNSGVMMAEALPIVITATRYEQTDSHLAWAGTWLTETESSASGGSFSDTQSSGASVTIKFSGISIGWIGIKGSNAGIAKVTLDGGSPIQVDCYSASTKYAETLWQSGSLASGNHTVKIECTGTCSAASTSYWICVDAFDIIGTTQ
jgi:hypothetical protein